MTVPYFDDEWSHDGQRAARDSDDGKTYYVPEDMTYQEWKEKFAEGKTDEQVNVMTDTKGHKIKSAKPIADDPDVHHVCNIDTDIYQCITEDITSDEVIITSERIDHINAHHPGVYGDIKESLSTALVDPDYIMPDKQHPDNTGIVLKKLDKENLRIALRVHTSADPEGYKNSIMSAWTIGEERWKRYLKNQKPLYAKDKM